MYQKEKEQLNNLLTIIQECLKSKNFTNEEKTQFVDMATKILAMLKVL